MNWETIKILFIHELKMLVRDRRTVVMAIVLPLLIMPLMLFASRFTQGQREQKLDDTVYRYTIIGTEADNLRSLIKKGYATVKSPDREPDGLSMFMFEELPVADPDSSLKAGDIHFYLEAVSGADADEAELADQRISEAAEQADTIGDSPSSSTDQEDDETDSLTTVTDIRYPGVPVVNIYFQANRDASDEGHDKMLDLLMLTRRIDRENSMRAYGLSVEPENVMKVASNSVATAEQMTGSWVGRILPIMLIFLMLTGGSVAAMDSVAGEKERGSLETLLTTSVLRMEIVTAKQLAILAVALTITCIQVVNLLCYLTFKVIELPPDFAVDVPPLTLLILFLLLIPVASFISSILLMISSYAKSFKETQLYYFPVFLVTVALASAAFLPAISLRSAIAIVPIANVSVAVREVMVGNYDWLMLAVTFVVMVLAAVWMVRTSAHMLSMERLVTASEADEADFAGGPALFPKHVLRWFGVMWAVLFAVAANIPQLATFERQLLFNELVIFIGFPALMIWKYRLKIQEVLALRPVKPVVWLIVLVLIPSVQLTGVSVFYVANLIFPVPESVLEEFAKQILPQDIPLWKLFVYIAIIPGICEEIGFRGTLLYGLRKRFHPVLLVIVIGAIFGVFHIALFRIIPTGFLGIVLTGVALMTGSIFPAMLLHIGNNGFAVLTTAQGISIGELDWWYYVIGTVVFFICLYLLYLYRTPYPDLKKGKPPTGGEIRKS